MFSYIYAEIRTKAQNGEKEQNSEKQIQKEIAVKNITDQKTQSQNSTGNRDSKYYRRSTKRLEDLSYQMSASQRTQPAMQPTTSQMWVSANLQMLVRFKSTMFNSYPLSGQLDLPSSRPIMES